METACHTALYTPSSIIFYHLGFMSWTITSHIALGFCKCSLASDGSFMIFDLPCDSNQCQTGLVSVQSKGTTEKTCWKSSNDEIKLGLI